MAIRMVNVNETEFEELSDDLHGMVLVKEHYDDAGNLTARSLATFEDCQRIKNAPNDDPDKIDWMGHADCMNIINELPDSRPQVPTIQRNFSQRKRGEPNEH